MSDETTALRLEVECLKAMNENLIVRVEQAELAIEELQVAIEIITQPDNGISK